MARALVLSSGSFALLGELGQLKSKEGLSVTHTISLSISFPLQACVLYLVRDSFFLLFLLSKKCMFVKMLEVTLMFLHEPTRDPNHL